MSTRFCFVSEKKVYSKSYILIQTVTLLFEPALDKTNTKDLVRPEKAQISLRIRAILSESSLIACAFLQPRAIQEG